MRRENLKNQVWNGNMKKKYWKLFSYRNPRNNTLKINSLLL